MTGGELMVDRNGPGDVSGTRFESAILCNGGVGSLLRGSEEDRGVRELFQKSYRWVNP